MKVVAFPGQSLAVEMFTVGTSFSPSSHTHMWDGSNFVAPTGDGATAYGNWLHNLTGEEIYLIPCAVGGSALLQNDNGGTGYWLDTSSGSPLSNAISAILAALATIPGCTGLDRAEFWQGQQDCFALGYADMFTNYRAGLGTLQGLLESVLGTGFRFAVWPVGRLPSGLSQQVLRAQLIYAQDDPVTREPGPSSHDQPTRDGVHLTAGGYAVMGYRGALNAWSYFCAKTAGTLAAAHGGAGPRAVSLSRNGAMALVNFDVKPGGWLMPVDPWALPGTYSQTDVNLTTNWGLWLADYSAQLTLTDGRIVGGAVRLLVGADPGQPVRCGHAWMQGCSGADVYDNTGQVALPFTPEMLVSA